MDTAPADLVREAVMTTLVIAGPILLIALAVGVVMALVQAATQVQDQAVSTVPKLLACGAAIALLAGWMASRLVAFAIQMWGWLMQLPSPPVLALGLATCRVAGVCLLAPVVASPVVPRRVAFALAVLLGAAALPGALDAHAQDLPSTLGGAVGCAALECALGAAMGLMALLPVAALRTAGSLCGVQMGLGFGSLYDSAQADEPGAWDGIEQLLGMAALAVFVWAGGLESLALGVLRSFDYVPIASALGLSSMAAMLTRGLLACSELALRVALPVTAVLLAETLVTGVLSRAMPALGPVQFGFPVRVGIGLLALAAGAAATQDALHGASGAALDAVHAWMTGGAA